MGPFLSGAVIFAGIIQCLYGGRFLKAVTAVGSFLFGLFAGMWISDRLGLDRGVVVGSGVVVGLVTVWVVSTVYKVGIFCFGALGGLFLSKVFTVTLSLSNSAMAPVIFAGLAGILALLIEGIILSALTCIVGGGMVTIGIHGLRVGALDYAGVDMLDIFGGLAFFVVGLVKQKKA